MQTNQNEQVVGRVPDDMRSMLRPSCGLCQTVATASGNDAGSDCQIPRITDAAGGFGLP